MKTSNFNKKNKNKLKLAIFISVFLHLILFMLLNKMSFNKINLNNLLKDDMFLNIKTVSLDSEFSSKNFNIKKSTDLKNNIIQNNIKEHNENIIPIEKIQNLKQDYFKDLIKKRIEIKKSESKLMKTKQENVKDLIKSVNKFNGIQKDKYGIEEISKDINNILKKNNLDKSNKSLDISNFLNGLILDKNVIENKNIKPSFNDIDDYALRIRLAIENNFYDAYSYRGKNCILKIKISPDGKLIDVKTESGDPMLCKAALIAVRQTEIPAPPSQDIYEKFKDMPIYFNP